MLLRLLLHDTFGSLLICMRSQMVAYGSRYGVVVVVACSCCYEGVVGCFLVAVVEEQLPEQL